MTHVCLDPMVDRGPGSHGRVRATESQSLDLYFTIAFDRATMLQTVRVDRVSARIDLSVWLHGVVPECYRPHLLPIIEDTFALFRGSKLTDQTVGEFVDALRRAIFARLDPIHPGAC